MPNTLPAAVSTIDVQPGYHPFVDHRYAHAGTARWVDSGGRYHNGWGLESPTAVTAAHRGVPHGIELRLQPAARTEPFIRATESWERQVWWPKVIRDSGLYRMWYEAVPPDHWDPAVRLPNAWSNPVFGGLLCYAESDDGLTWRKPALRIQAWAADPATNIVLGRESVGPMGLHGASVFVDSHAASHERYKAVWFADVPPEDRARLTFERPDAVDPRGLRHGLYGGVSPDGLHWRVLPEPLGLYGTDTLQVAEWDAERHAYVWYARGHLHGRRTITRSESADFRRFPLPQPVLVEPPVNKAWTDLYTNGKTRYPGDPSTHLMFPTLYDRSTDSSSFGVAASADGVAWTWAGDGVALEAGRAGSFDAGSMFAGTGLVELPDNRVGFPYGGYTTPHKFPANLCESALAWCTWPQGRIAGFHTRRDGQFSTQPLRLHGRHVRVNARTEPGGWVRIGLADGNGSPIRGRTVDDAAVIEGDHLDSAVRWADGADVPVSGAGTITLHVRMVRATMFGFRLEA